jgi:hypothetical protein
MNDLYHWNAEVMVTLEMEEMKKEVDSIRLLHDAELSNPNLYERTAIAVGNALVKLGQHLQKNFTDPHQAYETTSSKYAA